VANNLEAVLRKIENWHQGPIAGYRISYESTQGAEHVVDGMAKQREYLTWALAYTITGKSENTSKTNT
jgi:hypothetical protein